MTRNQFFARCRTNDPRGLNRAIQRHVAKVEAMTEAEFAIHWVNLQARHESPAIKAAVSRMAQEAFR